MTKLVSENTKTALCPPLHSTTFECAWKWYFRTFLGLPEETNEHLEFGSKVHSAIDQILKSEKYFAARPRSGAAGRRLGKSEVKGNRGRARK